MKEGRYIRLEEEEKEICCSGLLTEYIIKSCAEQNERQLVEFNSFGQSTVKGFFSVAALLVGIFITVFKCCNECYLHNIQQPCADE